ncbi:hypothetical protein ACGFMK_26675 [Amycolatopsis sp. NPDC049252]|uniref:hypothetical protein n=1 Tax=Amycolatopsis sp. NPDC049252 TaxID=3363933 RepID=UPI003718FB35
MRRIRTAVQPELRTMAEAAGFAGAEQNRVVRAIADELARRIDGFDSPEAILDWLVRAVAREVQRKHLADSALALGYVPDRDRRLLSIGDRSRLSDQEQRFLEVLLETDDDHHAIAEALRIPIGSVGPTRERVLRKLRGHREAHPRADLEAALRAHPSAPESPTPRRGLRHFLGLTTPAPPEVRPGDRTIAAVQTSPGPGGMCCANSTMC